MFLFKNAEVDYYNYKVKNAFIQKPMFVYNSIFHAVPLLEKLLLMLQEFSTIFYQSIFYHFSIEILGNQMHMLTKQVKD